MFSHFVKTTKTESETLYTFFADKIGFACISTFGYENQSTIFEIWVAKNPDISDFFVHVINFVMPICIGNSRNIVNKKEKRQQ